MRRGQISIPSAAPSFLPLLWAPVLLCPPCCWSSITVAALLQQVLESQIKQPLVAPDAFLMLLCSGYLPGWGSKPGIPFNTDDPGGFPCSSACSVILWLISIWGGASCQQVLCSHGLFSTGIYVGCKVSCCSQERAGVQHCKYLITLNGFTAWSSLVASYTGVGGPGKPWDTAFKWKQSFPLF